MKDKYTFGSIYHTKTASRQVIDKERLLFVFHEISADLKVFIFRKLGAQQEVDDLFQETYVNVAELSDTRIANIGDARSFIFGVANNMVLRHHTKVYRNRQMNGEDAALANTICPNSSPDKIYESKRRAELLTAALRNMPAKRRQIFILYRFKNMPVRDIALELGMSEHAVDKNIVRALSFCRDWLNRREG